jgi:release factor glutamine methyltransferase
MTASLSIQDALNRAGVMLAARDENPALEAALLLAYVLEVPRVRLHSHPEQPLRSSQREAFFALVERRTKGEPLAYLTGRREFWSLELVVNEHTLIPRPETELLVQLALERIPTDAQFTILDLGTGSGAIALAIAGERPRCRVTATDVCSRALDVARANAQRLSISNVTFREGAWFAPVAAERFDVIVSNPPYVAQNDPHLLSGDLPAEPALALVAGPTGMEMITVIARQAPRHLQTEGWLLMEHGYDQGSGVADLLNDENYRHVQTWRDLAGKERITAGQWR